MRRRARGGGEGGGGIYRQIEQLDVVEGESKVSLYTYVYMVDREKLKGMLGYEARQRWLGVPLVLSKGGVLTCSYSSRSP